MQELRVIISGGGTGGHIFPAISIANALKELRPNTQILFIGAKDRMEMQRIPAAGYDIVGLPIRGLIRPLWKPGNIGILFDFIKSKHLAKKYIKKFRPNVAVGVGGYASSATLNAAYELGIPCLIQEQNSFAGLTNKSLAQKAKKICVAYEGMERFFPKENIMLTGNPVRQNLLNENLIVAPGQNVHFEPGRAMLLRDLSTPPRRTFALLPSSISSSSLPSSNNTCCPATR